MKAFFLSSLLCLAFGYSAQAQQTAELEQNEESINWAAFETELDESSENWSLHLDQNRRKLYIDFEALGGKMSRLSLSSDENQEIVAIDDHLFDLPSNTIYELDLSKLEKGNYTLVLHSYTERIQKAISID